MDSNDAFSGKSLLEVEEVARYLGVKETTVYRWCRDARIACFKIGKSWRIRPSAVEEFLQNRERRVTLHGKLKQFLNTPASIVGIAQNTDLLHRLDASFLKLGEERGALLVKFHGGEPSTVDLLRQDFEAHGLEASRLEREGRLIFSDEKDPLEEREEKLERLVEEERKEDGEVWVSFDWVEDKNLEAVLQQQNRLMKLVSRHRLTVKTALLEDVADDWPMRVQRRALALHSGMVWISDSGLSVSQMTPLASDRTRQQTHQGGS